MALAGDFNGDGTTDYTATVTTDGSGNYLFDNLPAGQYEVSLDPATLPPGLWQTYDPDSLYDGASRVTLGGGERNMDQDFGYAKLNIITRPPIPPDQLVPPGPELPETPFIRGEGSDVDDFLKGVGGNNVDAFLEGPALSQKESAQQPALTTAPTMFTGHAEPGTILRLTMYDAQGNVIATHTAPTDTGGNWLANFQMRPDSEMPHTIVIKQTTAVYNRSTEGGYNLRTHFSPSFGSKAVTTAQGDTSSIMGGLAEHIVSSLHRLYNGQVDVRWDSTSPYESSVTSTNPGQSQKL